MGFNGTLCYRTNHARFASPLLGNKVPAHSGMMVVMMMLMMMMVLML